MAVSPSASRLASRPRRRRPSRLTKCEIIAAIRRWHELYGEPPTMMDWDPSRARQRGQEWRVERYRGGDWPSLKSVRNHFGRLSDAVAAAGLVPRFQGQQRPREALSLDDDALLHVAHLRAMRSALAPADRLAAGLRDVARARSSGELDDLRVALIGVAAAALVWARDVSATDAQPTAAAA